MFLLISSIRPGLEQLELLTKGDANPYDDVSLYKTFPRLSTHHVAGKVVGYVSVVLLTPD